MDARSAAAMNIEALIRAHQPDDDGDCGSCKASGESVPYPCEPRLFCEQIAVALQRRRSRAGGTAFQNNG